MLSGGLTLFRVPGVFTLLLTFSAYILRYRLHILVLNNHPDVERHKDVHSRSHIVMLVVVVAMFAIATIFWAVTVASLMQAVERPAQYALLDAHSISAKGQVLLICQGLNVRNFW